MADLVQVIKKAAVEAVEASVPCNVMFGTVVSVNPLSVRIDQKLTISSNFLTVTSVVRSIGVSSGDKVILIRQKGGQRYVIIDKEVDYASEQ